MSKRRKASELMFRKKNALKYPVNVVIETGSGTGTVAKGGVLTVVASSGVYVSTRVYLTLSATTQIGTVVGTA